jgi:hypothetical protein
MNRILNWNHSFDARRVIYPSQKAVCLKIEAKNYSHVMAIPFVLPISVPKIACQRFELEQLNFEAALVSIGAEGVEESKLKELHGTKRRFRGRFFLQFLVVQYLHFLVRRLRSRDPKQRSQS